MVRRIKTEEIVPVEKEAFVPYNPKPEPHSPNSLITSMGRFYEVVTQAFYGGETNDIRFESRGSRGYSVGTEPDIIDPKRKLGREVKGTSLSRSTNITNTQILANLHWFLERGYYFDYPIYRHHKSGLRSHYKPTEERLFSDLAKETEFAVIIPYDIIFQLALPWENGETSLARNYEKSSISTYPSALVLARGD